MKKENIIIYLIGVWVSILILSSMGVWLLDFSNSKQSIPIHATVEASGSIIALFLAFFLFKFDNDSQYLSRYHFASIALIAMGIFELFHAISLPGSLFVWFHTIGLLLGSILFLSVFLPEKKVSLTLYYGLPIVTAIVSLGISIFLLFHGEMLPSAIVNGYFSTSEIVLNNLSGFLFFLAAYSFIRYYRMEQESKDLYFIGLTIMLGSAAFLFQNSVIWESYWWYWHFIRLGGLLFVLLYFIRFIAEKNKNFISREIQSSIVDFSADAIITISPNGIILTWNASSEKLFGYTIDEAVGKPMVFLYSLDWASKEAEIRNHILEGASLEQLETVFISKKGIELNVAISLAPLKNSNGEIIGLSKIVRDITDKKRAEDQIRILNSELERKVVERTAALQSAYDEMEAFTYSVSHDLRSPLRATDGFSQALLEDYGSKLDATAQDYLSRIRSASQK
ncbi:MAG TPA: PAS domain S-box protein, partial [Sulfuricurvum sp.]|nr:PAS domain S-box protein [Sulfuricurvum sp.]